MAEVGGDGPVRDFLLAIYFKDRAYATSQSRLQREKEKLDQPVLRKTETITVLAPNAPYRCSQVLIQTALVVRFIGF